MRCEEVAGLLPAILDGPLEAPADVVDHVEQCLACQAELARYRRMLRRLHQLRGDEIALSEGDLRSLLDAAGNAATRRAVRSALGRHRFAYAGALGGALLAGVAALALTRSRGARRAVQL